MRFIRQIIITLAALAIFIILSVFSTIEYSNEEVDLDNREDKLPLVGMALEKFDNFMLVVNNLPVLGLLPAAKVGTDYEVETAKDIYTKVVETSKDDHDSWQDFDWTELGSKIKEKLSKDWSRP